MRKIVFKVPVLCTCPEFEFSVEQAHVTLHDIMSGNYPNSSPSGDYVDATDDPEDDFDDVNLALSQLDNDFEQEIYNEKHQKNKDASVVEEKEVDNE